MDRRQWFGLLGSGIGASLAGEACAADGHGGLRSLERQRKEPRHAPAPQDDRQDVLHRLPGIFTRKG